MSKTNTQQKQILQVCVVFIMTIMLLKCTHASNLEKNIPPALKDATKYLKNEYGIKLHAHMKEIGPLNTLTSSGNAPETSENALESVKNATESAKETNYIYLDQFFKKIANPTVQCIITLSVFYFRTNWMITIPILLGTYIIPLLNYLIHNFLPKPIHPPPLTKLHVPPPKLQISPTEIYLMKLTVILETYEHLKDELKLVYEENVRKKLINLNHEDVTATERKIYDFFQSLPTLEVSDEFKEKCENSFDNADFTGIEGGNAYVTFVNNFAIKRITRGDRDLDEQELNYIKREVMLAIVAHLYYPDLFVRTYGMFCKHSYCYIIMDRYGQSIISFSPEHFEIENLVSKLLQFSNKTIDALENLYFNHHDIKPGNILFKKGEFKFRIIDFGFGSFHGIDEYGKYDTMIIYTKIQPTTSLYAHVIGWTVFMGWDTEELPYYQNFQMIQRYHQHKDGYAFGMIFIKYYLGINDSDTLYKYLYKTSSETTGSWFWKISPKEKYLEAIKKIIHGIIVKKRTEIIDAVHSFIKCHVLGEYAFWGQTKSINMMNYKIPEYLNYLVAKNDYHYD